MITNNISRCLKNRGTWRTMNFYKVSSNFPVPDIFEQLKYATKEEWFLEWQWISNSYDLSSFNPWRMVCAINSVFTIEWPFSWGQVQIVQKIYNPSWTLIMNKTYSVYSPSLSLWEYSARHVVSFLSVNDWEISRNWMYFIDSSISGVISERRVSDLNISNHPWINKYTPWYIWIDWTSLCWISANWHKHTCLWKRDAYCGSWIWNIRVEWEHVVWVWQDWYKYLQKYWDVQRDSILPWCWPWYISWKTPWYIYVDNEFWLEHIWYIDASWRKWILKSWANPYYFGSEP